MSTTTCNLAFKSLAIAALLLVAGVADARIGSDERNHDTKTRTLQQEEIDDEEVDEGGAVYIMTNRVSGVGNSVLVFDRSGADGTLTRVGLFDTGGLGGLSAGPNAGEEGPPVDSLASQNSLLLSKSKRCLFAVNAGSNTITTFKLSNNGRNLDRVDVYPSGGEFPVSVTQRANTLYVLNAGNDGNVSGFRYGERGCTLAPLASTSRSLNNVDTNPPFFVTSPAQVSITPNGRGLVATLKGMHNIHYWSLSTLGFPSDEQIITDSHGFTPFSFTFDDNDHLLVSEAFGTSSAPPPPLSANTGAVSSYSINEDGSLSLISGSVGTGQTATCWVQYFNGYAYTTNNEGPNPSISILSVGQGGQLELVDTSAANGDQGLDHPIDLGLTQDGNFLYALSTASVEADGAGRPRISVFENNGDNLELIQILQTGLPLTTTTPQFEDTQGVFGLAVL